MSADLNADGRSDVLSSSPESIGTAYDTGFMALKGSYSGITSYGAKGIHQDHIISLALIETGTTGRLGADSWVGSIGLLKE